MIIGGVSGSGKSTALKAFEDIGYFCIDNLPAPLITSLVDLMVGASAPGAPSFPGSQRRFALLLRLRERGSYSRVEKAVDKLREKGAKVTLLFFECQDEEIVRRFQETRRPHPLLLEEHGSSTIIEALAEERMLLSDFREAADRIIDTTSCTPHDVRRIVEQFTGHQRTLQVIVTAFGFKYGIPHDADLVVDVRFLPNPHFVAELHELTGEDPRVAEFVFHTGEADTFLKHYSTLLKFLIPRYQQEGKRYLTVAVGCTGGKHRSVAVSQRLVEELKRGLEDVEVRVKHRDKSKA